jgi:putative SOS response-associated peptidase YedK
MCGRFVRSTNIRDLGKIFDTEDVLSQLDPSYNIAPTQPIAVIMVDGKRKLVSMKWGLIPHWAKDPEIGSRMINARAETIDEKPSFKHPLKRHRCLILADGFYEWKTEDKKKYPSYIHLKSSKPFAMAGIYDSWQSPTGEVITSCSIITTEANEFMKQIHHRMPVIINPEDYDVWLNPDVNDPVIIKNILSRPIDPGMMESHEVSPEVNSTSHNSPDCILPWKKPDK